MPANISAPSSASWKTVMVGSTYDPNNDQQSSADSDLLGNATNAMLQAQAVTAAGDTTYYYRVRVGSLINGNASSSFYLALDLTRSGNFPTAELFIEARYSIINGSLKKGEVVFHKADFSNGNTGFSPSTTAWSSSSTDENLEYSLYSKPASGTSGSNDLAYIGFETTGTDLDGDGNNDYWIVFAFTLSSLNDWAKVGFSSGSVSVNANNVVSTAVTGSNALAMFAFTSTSQTANGDVAGVNDRTADLTQTWSDLGVVVNSTLDDLGAGKPSSPTVNLLTTADTTPVVTGTAKLADTDGNGTLNDTLAVVINGVTYNGADVKLTRVGSTDTYLWAVQVTAALASGTYSVAATATRDGTLTATDITSSELVVNTALPAQTPTITLFNDNVSPDQGDYTSGARTNDTTPTITGVLDASLTAGSLVRLYQSVNGGSYVLLGTANVSGTGWTYTTSALTNGSTYTYRAVVYDGTNEGTRSNQFNLTVDTTAPTVTAAISGYSDDVGASKGNITTSSNGTTPATDDSTPTLYGAFAGTASATAPPLAAGERLAVYRGGSLVGYANLVPTVNSTDGSITGYTWEYPEAELASGTYSYSVRVVDGAGNLGTQSSAFAVTVSLPVDVNDISANEASAYAVFKVSMTASAGANLTLTLTAGTATAATDYSSTIQVSTDGTTWSNYSSSFARGSNTTLWVRTVITNDGTYEGVETFSLTVSDGTNSAVGTATILDDGTGSVFTGNASGGNAVTSGTPDDDRTISVSSSQATVNEASSYVFFTVNAQAGATVVLDPRDVNDSGAGFTSNLGSSPGVYYSFNNGLTWNTYTSAGVVVPSGGSFLVRVDISPEQDTVFENSETLGLRAWYQSNTSRLADGTVTLRDNGSGAVFNADGTTNGSATLDNDTGPSIANATVTLNENSANGTAVTNVNDAISGTDLDAAGAALTYSITAGNTGSAFSIDSSTGAITVANGSLLNFEGIPSYALTVSATNGTKTATGVITVNLLNVNEAPSVTSGATGTVAENAATSTVVYTVTATEPDASPTPSYSIGGADAGAFNINSSTGAITLKASADFETKSSYLIDVIVTDQGGLTGTRAVTINVTDVNETPVVTSGSTGAVPENAATNTVVYTATSTDPDNGQTRSYSLAGTDAGSFDIDSTTGAVTLKSSANFEAKSSYSITICATDNGTPALTGTQAVTINVTDMNEAPTVTSGSAVTISNGTAAGATVYTATATDPDAGQTLTYSLSGTDASAFTINGGTGVVTINSTANSGTKSSYSIDVVATDNGTGTLSNTKAVTVTVSASSNQAPVITSASTTTVVENTVVTTPVYTATATDADAGQTRSYSLDNTGDAALFSIDATTGAVRLLAASNYEAKNSYSITVRATDNGTPALSATQAVTISVSNVDEVAPTFTSGNTATAAENQNLLYTGAATDTDFNSPATANSVTYTLKNPTSGDANLLNINSSTGAVTLKTGNLDFEGGKTSYAFTVIATDAASNATELPVTATVSDVNEAPTAVSLTNQTTSLAENTSTASRIKVADIGITDDALGTNTATLSGTYAASFEVVGSSLYLKAGTVLNYETQTSYGVTVNVADSTVAGSTPITANFTLNVTNVDEVAPAFTSGITASAAENQNLLYTAAANDTVDFTNQMVTYALKPGVGDQTALAINAGTGAVTLASGNLNFETKNSYTFTVVASDATGNSAERSVTVSVTDLNEAPTVTSGATANIGDGSAAGSLIYTATATDPDAGQTLTYSLTGADASLLTINASTGAVSVNSAVNRSTKPSYSFSVVATDNGTGNLSDTKAVTVTVNPSTNQAPIITSGSTASVVENSAVSSPVYTVAATDANAGQTLTYSLGSGADESLFSIDATTGAVRLLAAANYEAKNSYSITVRVTDNGTPALTTSQTVTVSVSNVDEVAPAFNSGTSAIATENQNLLYTAAATDTVDFTNQVVTYSLKPGVGDASALVINPSTGAVRLASGSLDYETKTNHSFTVVASDATGNAAERAVMVAVADVAETVQSLTVEDAANVGQSPADTSVVEGGTLVYRVTLPGNPTVASSLALTISGTSSSVDRGTLQFSNGVTLSGGNLQIPANVNSFTITVPTVDDGLVEPTETLTLILGGASATGTITDNDIAPPAPVITDVTEIPSDPTPHDLYTADTTQVLKVTGRAGHALRLYTADGNPVALSSGAVTETAPGSFTIDAQAVTLVAGDYIVRQVDAFGNESADSNRFTIDSTPALEEMTTYRVLSTGNVLNGRLAVIDQGRTNLWALQSTVPPTSWVDADGQSTLFGLVGGAPGTGSRVTLTAASGSTLSLDTLTAAYTYTPASNAVQDVFTATVRDPGGKGGNLILTFEPRDLKDRDGVPGASEDALASRVVTTGTAAGDRNGDGVQDSQQNAVTTLAWVRKTNFDSAVAGQVAAVPTTSIITVVAHDSTTSTAASAVSQLIDFKVLGLNRDGTGTVPTTGLAGLSTPWDPIGFSIEPLQSLGLIDIDPNRAGLQTRVTLDISASALSVGTFTAYKKWIAADTIAAAQAAGAPLITLDGVALTNANQAGWYDFTQRVAGGDGARFITANGIITGIELILTDNAFGDVDFTVGRITDPGMPTGGSDSTPPTITGPTGGAGAAQSSVAIPENRRAVTNLSANEAVDWSIAGGVDGALFSIDASGALSFTTPADYERPIDSDRNNVYSVTVRARDAAGNASLQTLQVTVTDVDDTAPLITGPSNGQGAAASSVQVSENTVVATTLQANEAVTWDLVAGADRELFSISADGTLRFLSAPDFEQPRDSGRDNFYEVTVRALDRSGNMSLQTVTVQVLDVDEVPPVITGPSGGPGAATSARQVPENTTAVARLSANEPVSWSLAGGPDAALLRLDADGTLRFAAAPDFERPGDSNRDNLYEVQVRATDAAGNASLQTITIAVTDVDEIPPLITGPSQAAGSASSSTAIPENTTAVTRVRANEAVTWSMVGGADAALLRLDEDGTLRFAAAPDFEQPADADRNNRYEVQIRATDLAGNVSLQSVSISITDVDEVPPKITGPGGAPGTTFASVVVPENTPAVTSFEADEPVTWSLVDGRDAAWFTLSSAGALSFKSAPDYEAPSDTDGNNVYELQLRAADRAGNVSIQSVTVTVFDVDEIPPVISGPGSAPGATASAVKILENATEVFNLKADEPVKWSIVGGVDASLFSLGADGALKFVRAPDYEKPLDSNQDNNYAVTIRAVDTQGNASEQNILVTVDDVNEPQALFVLSLRNGDRWMSGSWTETAKTAAALGVTPIKGDFSVLPKATVDTVPLKGWLNILTGDFLYVPQGTSLPYSCYVPADTLDLNHVPKPGKGSFDVHLFVNSSGVTQTVGVEQARQMGLTAQGYQDMGAIFASAAPWEPGPVALVGSTPDAMPGFGG